LAKHLKAKYSKRDLVILKEDCSFQRRKKYIEKEDTSLKNVSLSSHIYDLKLNVFILNGAFILSKPFSISRGLVRTNSC
jgi:hypothetical protein